MNDDTKIHMVHIDSCVQKQSPSMGGNLLQSVAMFSLLITALCIILSFVGCSAEKVPLDVSEGMFYFTSEVEFSFGASGPNLGSPSNSTVWLIPPDMVNASGREMYNSNRKKRLFVLSEINNVKGGSIYTVTGIDVAKQIDANPNSKLDTAFFERLTRSVWPDMQQEKIKRIAEAIKQLADRGEFPFLLGYYSVKK